jgi:hypothetical protein
MAARALSMRKRRREADDGIRPDAALKQNGTAILVSNVYNARGKVANATRLFGLSTSTIGCDSLGRLYETAGGAAGRHFQNDF